uniref:Peroxisomal biogenesis factor 5-like b n=1 Tax=Acanthochromis polyacanthus TaxID=80966 RepID=A0A3Q1FR50_9TELE
MNQKQSKGTKSRPLLSPSIDDFLSESRSDASSVRPISSNAAVLTTALDLVDLSEPSTGGSTRGSRKRSPLRRKGSSKSPRHRTRADETELIQVEVEHLSSPRTPERVSLDSGNPPTPLRLFDFVLKFAGWLRSPLPTFLCLFFQDCGASRQRRRTRSLLAKNESLEDEFVRAKAAVESDTEFWDKMQAEWEELARRNWLEDSEEQRPIPPTVSPAEKGYYFNTNNPYRDLPNAFTEGQDKAREGDLNAAVLLLEAAILQDPQDSEWLIHECVHVFTCCRCLELRPNNLPALMALAVSFTNGGMQREACDALRRWISHNPRYRHLVQEGRSPLQGSPLRGSPLQAADSSDPLQDVLLLFQEAALLNLDCVDPDLQTGLGVLFNLSSDFNKAVEAFSAALSVRPQDYLLWNRLGATLANGNRSEEAVEAYTRALELQPGFIRSRYNLGISCINLGAHREAVSNFLTALNQQRRTQRCSHQQMSANIWSALRIAISLMDRPELFQAVNIGDLDLLMRAFDMADV